MARSVWFFMIRPRSILKAVINKIKKLQLNDGQIGLIEKPDNIKLYISYSAKRAEKGVHFKSLSEPEFDTTSANGKFLLQIFAAVAEFERNLISERTKVGLANARRRKKLLGRPAGPKKETVEKYRYARHLYENEHIPIDQACKKAGISKTAFYTICYLKLPKRKMIDFVFSQNLKHKHSMAYGYFFN